MEWNNLDTCRSFQSLKEVKPVKLQEILNSSDAAQRVKAYSVPAACGIIYNYAAKFADEKIIDLLQELSDEQMLIKKYRLLLNGEPVNTGENRKVLHHLTRGQLGNDVIFEGINLRDFYLTELQKIECFSKDVHTGKIASARGKKITDIVQIGIGGSDLGPRAVYIALKEWAKKNGKALLNAHFISNIDSDDAEAVLNSLDLETVLFVLVSKSGTTLETLSNEQLIKHILKEKGLEPEKQFIAVTGAGSPLAGSSEFLQTFYMDDFIGGRYSVTSVCGGVILSLAFGADTFKKFLSGAAEADKAALKQNIRKNAPLLDALLGIYERNILGFNASAVLPYSQALRRFPAHLQQLDMESNGKTVSRLGAALNYKTGPIIFGEAGTNGQHSFYQLLHQGREIIPLQFIGFEKNQIGSDFKFGGATGQEKLLANLTAQIVAFACGSRNTDMNKNFEGGRPSSLIYGKELCPESLGALLSHYENKIMFQGFAWNINSFDQEGVQLGKTLAKRVLEKNTNGALRAYADIFKL